MATAADDDHGNLLAALAWYASRAETGPRAPASGGACPLLVHPWPSHHGSAPLEAAIRRAGDDADPSYLANAFRAGSSLAVLQGDYHRARSLSESGLTHYRRLDDDVGITRSLSNLGAILHAEGEPELAIQVLDESVSRSETISDARLKALALNNRGDVALSQHDWTTAQRCFAPSLALLRTLDDTANIARSLDNLRAVALREEFTRHRRSCTRASCSPTSSTTRKTSCGASSGSRLSWRSAAPRATRPCSSRPRSACSRESTRR